jgi:Skp family chaperone for outer membrane proteins
MSTFTNEQQELHRDQFIKECRQKAWGAACHADWISTGLDKILAEFTKLSEENAKLGEEIKTLETALDSHTKDNRDARKSLQERRAVLLKTMDAFQANMQQGQQVLNGLYQNVESNLALAAHAEGWEWKESTATP